VGTEETDLPKTEPIGALPREGDVSPVRTEGATTVAILVRLALRFVAAFLRELSDSREDGDSQVVFTGSGEQGNCK